MTRDAVRALAGIAAILAVTWLYTRVLGVANHTTVALSFLLVVLLVAASSKLASAVATSIVAVACFNFFFLPPVGTWTIADPQNWVAFIVFLMVSLIGSNLSSAVRARAGEALAARDEMSRLFDLSRDILRMSDTRAAYEALARSILQRFALGYVALCLPRGQEWELVEAGTAPGPLDRQPLSAAFADAEKALEFDAAARSYTGHRTVAVGGIDVSLVPLRLGTRPIGLVATAGRSVESGTLDALAGLVAIAVERIQFLEERKEAELARQSEALKSALLASIAHDLKTPLTAIRVAAGNLQADWLQHDQQIEQSGIVITEVQRLSRLFDNILAMARIDAGAVSADRRWVHPAEIVSAAQELVPTPALLDIRPSAETLVHVDPRLTAAALSQLLENAVHYSPPASPIEVSTEVTANELVISVRDHGPGIANADLPHLFDRFYRGAHGRQRSGSTGMGLSIARGLVAAEGGRVWAENCAGAGARVSIAIPTAHRLSEVTA